LSVVAAAVVVGFVVIIITTLTTPQPSQVGKTSRTYASNSGSPALQCWPEDELYWISFLVVFLDNYINMQINFHKVIHGLFIPPSLQFVIHWRFLKSILLI
jgi:hypothetical protein